jgi:membrane protease YdiL (CAAX protease family)
MRKSKCFCAGTVLFFAKGRSAGEAVCIGDRLQPGWEGEPNEFKSDAITARALLGDVHWRPDRDTWVALGSYLLVVAGLYTAFQIFTTDHVAANFITFGPVTLAGLGVALPVLYTKLVRRRSLADLGLTTRQLIPSLVLSLVLGWDTYRNTLVGMDIVYTAQLVPLITMVLAVGLFEAIFFRGWLQLRFEAAFGLVPGLLLGALCYSLYHLGYGMAPGEMLYLFGLGLVFGAFFRLVENIFVLWPLYTPVGSLFSNLSDGLTMPFEATYGFLITLGLMLAVIIAMGQVSSAPANKKAISRQQPLIQG